MSVTIHAETNETSVEMRYKTKVEVAEDRRVRHSRDPLELAWEEVRRGPDPSDEVMQGIDGMLTSCTSEFCRRIVDGTIKKGLMHGMFTTRLMA